LSVAFHVYGNIRHLTLETKRLGRHLLSPHLDVQSRCVYLQVLLSGKNKNYLKQLYCQPDI
jgi:hypothetical protein